MKKNANAALPSTIRVPGLLSRKAIPEEEIRSRLRDNFFGLAEWQRYVPEMRISAKCIIAPAFPWDIDVLEDVCPFQGMRKIKETHFAFLGIRTLDQRLLNLRTWVELSPRLFQSNQIPRNLDGLTVAGKASLSFLSVCDFRWYLMPLQPLTYTRLASFQEQQAALPPCYEVPLAIEETTKRVLTSLVNGRNPVRHYDWMRCRDSAPYVKLGHTAVGTTEDGRIIWDILWDMRRKFDLLVGASRKHPNRS